MSPIIYNRQFHSTTPYAEERDQVRRDLLTVNMMLQGSECLKSPLKDQSQWDRTRAEISAQKVIEGCVYLG